MSWFRSSRCPEVPFVEEQMSNRTPMKALQDRSFGSFETGGKVHVHFFFSPAVRSGCRCQPCVTSYDVSLCTLWNGKWLATQISTVCKVYWCHPNWAREWILGLRNLRIFVCSLLMVFRTSSVRMGLGKSDFRSPTLQLSVVESRQTSPTKRSKALLPLQRQSPQGWL